MTLRKHYEGYCNMCRKLNMSPVPYRKFTPKEYARIKTLNDSKT